MLLLAFERLPVEAMMVVPDLEGLLDRELALLELLQASKRAVKVGLPSAFDLNLTYADYGGVMPCFSLRRQV
jgi:hypothetical protein